MGGGHVGKCNSNLFLIPKNSFFPNELKRKKTRKDGARPALFQIVVLFCVLLFCVVLCIVCVQMCTVLLPPGGYPIAVNKYIIIIISPNKKIGIFSKRLFG